MTQEERDLVLKDLSGRLPYGLKLDTPCGVDILGNVDINEGWINASYDVDEIKPYLRPMPSMTKEERTELGEVIKTCGLSPYGEITASGEDNLLRCTARQAFLMLNYLYSKQFDVNHFIDIDLALEAPEGMYKL